MRQNRIFRIDSGSTVRAGPIWQRHHATSRIELPRGLPVPLPAQETVRNRPVLLLARESLTPLVWEDVVHRMTLSEEQKLLSADRRQAGLYGEVTCPVHGPREQKFAVCFAQDRPGEHDRAQLSAMQVLAIHFYYAFARVHQAHAQSASTTMGLADSPPMGLNGARVLTHRERECLLWTARGKSASTISVILGLSENTINFYVKNAMRKLGTTNRVVAVVLAVRAGLIQP